MTAISLWMQEPGGSGIIKSWVSQRDRSRDSKGEDHVEKIQDN